MSIKVCLQAIAAGEAQTLGLRNDLFIYDFCLWYRDQRGLRDEGILRIVDLLTHHSEDYLEQECARFILETSE